MKEVNVTDVRGIKIGHAENSEGATGCTVILCEKGACAGVDVRGGGPASRETELLKPMNMVEQIHGVMLSGGSAFGLDSGSGAMKWLEEKDVGFDVGVGVVPIVCGASLFDLAVGDPKCRPDQAMGYQACVNASSGKPAEGNVGAGTGASVGKFMGSDRMMKSGIGTFALQIGELIVGAIVAVNAMGDVVDADSGKIIAGILDKDRKLLDCIEKIMYAEYDKDRDVFRGNTTIGCIVTNAKLTKSQANKLASTAHNGYARTIRPVHTSVDGDSIFAMSTCEVECMADTVGALAAEVMARAVNRAARKAESAYGLKAASDFDTE